MSSAWVTRLECPKGVKDEVKQARRAKIVAEGQQLEIGAQRAPRFLVYDDIHMIIFSSLRIILIRQSAQTETRHTVITKMARRTTALWITIPATVKMSTTGKGVWSPMKTMSIKFFPGKIQKIE